MTCRAIRIDQWQRAPGGAVGIVPYLCQEPLEYRYKYFSVEILYSNILTLISNFVCSIFTSLEKQLRKMHKQFQENPRTNGNVKCGGKTVNYRHLEPFSLPINIQINF